MGQGARRCPTCEQKHLQNGLSGPVCPSHLMWIGDERPNKLLPNSGPTSHRQNGCFKALTKTWSHLLYNNR